MKRGKWQGMLAIVRFNWPFYLVATLVFVGAIVGIFHLRDPWVVALFYATAAGSGYFVVVSLGVSHFVYCGSGNWPCPGLQN